MMKETNHETRPPGAVRLILLRQAIFGENTTAFAERLGISLQRLCNIENGYPLLSMSRTAFARRSLALPSTGFITAMNAP
jgi:hypothetical protein